MVAAARSIGQEQTTRPGAIATSRATPVHLASLTGLRFVAALLVVLYHVQIASSLALAPVVGIGYIGVSFFFILSGFVLTYTYLDLYGALRGSLRAFWNARLARIYPVYLCAFVVAALPFMWQHDPRANPLITGISALTLTQAWVPWAADAWNGPGWSLADEAFFYLLFPFVAVLIARLPRQRLLLAATVFWLAALAVPIFYIVANPDGLHTWGFADSAWIRIIRFNPAVRLPEFLLGVALGRLFMIDRAAWPKDATPNALALGLAACAAVAGIALAPAVGVPLPYILLHDGFLDVLFGLLIYTSAWGKGLVARAVATPIVVTLGEASYALYILHVPMRDWLGRAVQAPAPGDWRCLPYWLAYVCLCIALSLLALRFIEQPARRALRRAFNSAPS